MCVRVRGALCVNFFVSQDDSGWTPLMIAVNVADSDNVVSLLLQKGADINIKSKDTLPHFVLLSVANLILPYRLPRPSLPTLTLGGETPLA